MIHPEIPPSIDGHRIETAVTFFNHGIAESCGLSSPIQEGLMRDRLRLFGIAFVTTVVFSPSPGFSQAQAAQTRIPQQIVINGQNASGAYVATAGGQIQSFTGPPPPQYNTAHCTSR